MYLFRQKCIAVELIRKGSIYCTEHFHCIVCKKVLRLQRKSASNFFETLVSRLLASTSNI
jgi:hypothetical protein